MKKIKQNVLFDISFFCDVHFFLGFKKLAVRFLQREEVRQ